MNINPEYMIPYTTESDGMFLKYLENTHHANHQCIFVIKPQNVLGSNLFRSVKACGFGQSSFKA